MPSRSAVPTAAAILLVCAFGSAHAAGNSLRAPVLLVRERTVYAAWSEAQGARQGKEGVLFGPSGEALDTLEVRWARDDVAALGPRANAQPRTLAALDSIALVPAGTASALWVEAVAAIAGRATGTLRVPLAALPAKLDPALVTSLAEKQVVTQLYEGLVRFGPRLRPLPAAADSIAHVGRRWTFRLRKDARFHDGRPVRAEDVVASLQRALSPRTKAPRVEGLADAIVGAAAFRADRATNISGLTVLDSITIQIVTTRESAPLLDELAAPAAFLVPAAHAQEDNFARAPIGSGPFRLVRSDSDGVIVAAAPGRTAGVDTVEFRRVDGPEDAVLDFELGRLDVVAPRESDERRLVAQADTRVETLSVDEAATYYLGLNTRAPALADRGRRRALARSINRALAVRVLVPGRGRLAHGLVPPVLGLPELADSAWLAPAGPAPSFGAQALSLWVPDGSPTGVRLAEFVQANLARAGCRVTLTVRPWAEFERAVSDGRADLFYLSWFADGPDPIAFVSSLVESRRKGAGGNRTYYANAAVDSALAQARVAPTRERALALLREAEITALSDAPLVPLFHSVNVTLVRPYVTGLVLDPLGAPRYDGVEVRRGR